MNLIKEEFIMEYKMKGRLITPKEEELMKQIKNTDAYEKIINVSNVAVTVEERSHIAEMARDFLKFFASRAATINQTDQPIVKKHTLSVDEFRKNPIKPPNVNTIEVIMTTKESIKKGVNP
jgi:hypothetical protein